MSKDWSKIDGACTVHRYNGESRVFASFNEALTYYRYHLSSFGENFNGWYHARSPAFQRDPWWNFADRRVEYLIRDLYGMVIPLWKIEERARELRIYDRVYYSWCVESYFDYEANHRQGPVPNTGRRRRGKRAKWLRSPEIHRILRQEIQMAEDLHEYGVHPKPRAVRTDRDDIPKYTTKNWKSYRKTQYKS